MKKLVFIFFIIIAIGFVAILVSFNTINQKERNDIQVFNKDSKVVDVINNESFGDFGRLIFPVHRPISGSLTLANLDDVYVWYNYMSSDKTVEIVNYMKTQVDSGATIFYNIYSDEERRQNSELNDTGLFFFKGNNGAKTAIVNAGGGFSYVGAMQDSFPHALELSKKGYNAFALIYRPDSSKAMQDLARAVAFLHEHQEDLRVSMEAYSVWGGSAGARMTAWLGSYGTESFGEKSYPRPAAVIMQYTGLSEVTGNEPPTYANVGTSDSIASYVVMRNRINAIRENGVNAEIEVFEGLPHGYGIGAGTVAEGWVNNAIEFWERNINSKS